MYRRRGTGRCKYGGAERERSGDGWVVAGGGGGGEKIGREEKDDDMLYVKCYC